MISKEEQRKRRKDAYREAKAKRDADPRYQAMKEKAKEQRRATYQALRDEQRCKKLEEKRARIAEKDAALMLLMKPATELENTCPSTSEGKIVYVDFNKL